MRSEGSPISLRLPALVTLVMPFDEPGPDPTPLMLLSTLLFVLSLEDVLLLLELQQATSQEFRFVLGPSTITSGTVPCTWKKLRIDYMYVG